MNYENKTPGNAPEVIVEWVDPSSGDGVMRRWSIGWLLSTTHVSEGKQCLMLAGTWDEEGWEDLDAMKMSDVDYILHLGVD